MRVCIYLEFRRFMNGLLYRKVGTGLLSSYATQKKMLQDLSIPFTETWDDSCDILQINTPWLWSMHLARKARHRGKKIIIYSHVTMEDAMQVFRFMPLVAPLFKKYLTYAYGYADLVLSVSEYTRGLLIAYGLPPGKIRVQSNAVDTREFFADQAKRREGREEYKLNTLTVGTVALAIPRKGIDTFLNLAKRFPENQFAWFGKIYSSLLVKPIPKKDIPPNAFFSGYVHDIKAAFNSLDVFIFPSYEENQGMAILEAAAIRLPIVVRDIPVYKGWLIEGENCLKAKTDDEFADCLKRLIESKELRDKLSQGAARLAEKEDVRVWSRKLKEAYDFLLKN